ncbi:redoxin domain-containing protein [Georgenia phoenicis]|uniref:redoxin domain-containing protein n=1 Tax=unclassified Georgenia TaxID=2626815 RepID=UPI0039B11ED4
MAAVADRAPVLELPDTHGTPVRVGGARTRPQLVVFLPFAFSRVCGGELRALVEEPLTGVDVVAVTCDPVFTLRAWGEEEGVGFPLLSDFWPHGRAARAFGAFDDASGAPQRVTFLIDDDGAVAWSVRTPGGVARSVADYRAAVAALTGS